MEQPKKNFVNFYRNEGHYNWLNSKDKSAQYVFTFPHLTRDQIKEMDIKMSFLVDIEKDYDFSPESYTPLECLNEILHIYNGYWMHSGKDEVKKTIEYLESIEEEQEKLRHQYDIDYAKYKVVHWTNKLEKLSQEEV
jgi:hypothetical protein